MAQLCHPALKIAYYDQCRFNAGSMLRRYKISIGAEKVIIPLFAKMVCRFETSVGPEKVVYTILPKWRGAKKKKKLAQKRFSIVQLQNQY